MKEIVLDTETTGLSVKDGHRIVEIGCIELDNLIPTKNKFHFTSNFFVNGLGLLGGLFLLCYFSYKFFRERYI